MEAIYDDIPKTRWLHAFAPVVPARGAMFGAAARGGQSPAAAPVLSEQELFNGHLAREVFARHVRIMGRCHFYPMLPDIEKLLQLQVADKESRKLQEEIATLPKRMAVIESKLAGTKAQLEKARAAAKADEGNRKKFESAIQDLQGKISKYRDQSLAVKTNDQYKALLHEIQLAEQEIRSNADRILDVMVNVDARDREVKAAEAELKAETAEIEKEKEEARKITAADEAKLSEWNGKRDGLRSGVSDDLLRHYERVMKFRC